MTRRQLAELAVERRYEPDRAAMLAALRIVLRLPARIDEGGAGDDERTPPPRSHL